MKLDSTKNAKDLLNELKNENKDGILLYLSSGCCDGSALLCYGKDDFKLGSSDILLGSIENVEIYTHKNQYEMLKNSDLRLDVEQGEGSEYSLTYGKNRYFVLVSKVCKV